MVNRTCPVCSVRYSADPDLLLHGRQTTCSRACSYVFRGAKLQKRTTYKCAVCSSIIVRSPSTTKSKHGGMYCSRECHYAGRTAGHTKRVVRRPYQYTETSKASMIAAARKPKGRRTKHMLTCRECGVTVHDLNYGRPRKSGLKFCTLACCNAYRVGCNNPAWRGGHIGYYGPSWRSAQRAVRQRDNHVAADIKEPAPLTFTTLPHSAISNATNAPIVLRTLFAYVTHAICSLNGMVWILRGDNAIHTVRRQLLQFPAAVPVNDLDFAHGQQLPVGTGRLRSSARTHSPRNRHTSGLCPGSVRRSFPIPHHVPSRQQRCVEPHERPGRMEQVLPAGVEAKVHGVLQADDQVEPQDESQEPVQPRPLRAFRQPSVVGFFTHRESTP